MTPKPCDDPHAELFRRIVGRRDTDPGRVDRLTRAVLRDRRTQRQLRFARYAMAAAVVLALGGWWTWPTPPPPGVGGPLIAGGLAGADAVIDQITTLPPVDAIKLRPPDRWAKALVSAVPAFDAAKALGEPGQGVAEGLEPVTTGAVRAYEMLRREWVSE